MICGMVFILFVDFYVLFVVGVGYWRRGVDGVEVRMIV